MSEDKTTRLRLWLKIVPLLMIMALFGWCSSNKRAAAEIGPVKTELANLFMEQGLISGNEHATLADVAKTLGEPTMNGLLYEAAAGGSVEALKWLVAHGADPNNVGAQQGLTLLQRTALHPRLDRLEFMFGFGLDPLERSADGRGLLHLAAQGGLDTRVLELLLSKGLKVSDADNSGRLPMHFASVKSIGVLVGAGADVNAGDEAGMTALHQAAREGRNDAVAELLRNSASVFAKDKKGRTPLHYAAVQGSEAVVDSLLAGAAPVSARDNDGMTPKELGLEAREDSRGYRNVLDKL